MSNFIDQITSLPFVGLVALFVAVVIAPIGYFLKTYVFKGKPKGSSGITQNQKGGAFSKNTQIGNVNINQNNKDDGQ